MSRSSPLRTGQRESRSPITPVTIQVTGGGGTRTVSATGLPTGLSIDPRSGVVSGTVAGTVADNTVFDTAVTRQRFDGKRFGDLHVDGCSGIGAGESQFQIGKFFADVNRGDQVQQRLRDDGTFSAPDLPPGLSIDPQTGIISGTYLPGTVSPILTPVTVGAPMAYIAAM